ncbi:MAG TPA: uracil-DNA glycosylase [Verrucomicrobiae bacterium]|nr:uracil-DNA glycosylase [Verrucomicrobiae bacterium]
MSESYRQLLDATIQHVEDLKARGARHLAVAPETLRALATAAPRVAASPSESRSSRREEALTKQSEIRNPKSEMDSSLLTSAATSPSSIRHPPSAIEKVAAPPSAIIRPPSSPEKTAAFAALRERALACVKCPHLASSRKNVVFGVGSLDAQLMFVGEAPGADEDEQGEPFVGKAGQLLTKIIETTGLSRADVYIANILKCRPDTPGQSAGNRKPTPEEMQTCIPYLHEQIDLIRPKVIVALGATAVDGLLGKTVGITKLRGNWQTYRDTPLMPTFHPSYLLRNQSMAEKRRVWEDMLAVMEKLGMPISEKQRNFFLKG